MAAQASGSLYRLGFRAFMDLQSSTLYTQSMDFVTSHFGKMKLWPVEHFCNIFVLTFGALLLLYSAITPKSEDKHVVKVFNWSEVHLSEMTCYKIHTLVWYLALIKPIHVRLTQMLWYDVMWSYLLLCYVLIFNLQKSESYKNDFEKYKVFRKYKKE